MLTVFSVCHKDFQLCEELLTWVRELGQYPAHKALLVMSTRITPEQQAILMGKLKECGFAQAYGAKQRIVEESGWPLSPNRMWQLAAEFVEQKCPESWLWLESDAIPVREGWLDAIQAEYARWKRPYLGHVFDWVSETRQLPHLNGVCVYPANIRRYNPYSLAATAEPWDCTRPELTLKYTKETNVIFHELKDRATNMPYSFPDQESLSRIPQDCAVYHGNKDGTLIQRLREVRGVTAQAEPGEVINHSKPSHINLISTVKHKIAAFINGASTYSHAGNFGDTLYSMGAIKAAGGGDLIICPEQRKTAPCSIPITRAQYDFFEPLLKEQGYLRNVSYSEKYPTQDVHDLNTFRNVWVDHVVKKREGLDTLIAAHFWSLGIIHRFDDNDTWLRVPDPIVTGKIIIARSPRYNSPTFPWKRLVQQRGRDLLFVGLEHEYKKFEQDWGAKVSFWRVNDMLEMARLIAGAKVCVMNQSSPLAIAIGFGQRVICEECERSPDCRFIRDSYTGHLQVGPANLDFESL